MTKLTAFVCLLCVLLLSSSSVPQPEQGSPPEPAPMAEASAPARAAQAAPALTKSIRFMGLEMAAVPRELAAHMGLGSTPALLVDDLDPAAEGAQAGLRQFDVVLTVNGHPATRAALEEAREENGPVELAVARAGLIRLLTLVRGEQAGPRDRTAAPGFLSTDDLPADHPFRRLQTVSVLRAGYSNRVDLYTQQIQELDELASHTRGEAKQQAQVLRKQCLTQVHKQLQAWEKEFLNWVQAGLDPKVTAPVGELGLRREEVVPAPAVQAVQKNLDLMKKRISQGPTPATFSADIDPQIQKRHRQRVTQLTNWMTQLYAERVERIWQSGVRDWAQHDDRLGSRFDQRVQWVEKTVREIREHLEKRIICALQRSEEQFQKQLDRRLAGMEVPVPGEVEGCLTDMHAQVDIMAQRFLHRTGLALKDYEQRLKQANLTLSQVATDSLTSATEAGESLVKVTESKLGKRGPEPEPELPGWQVRALLRADEDRVNDSLLALVNEIRDGVRPEVVAVSDALREHRAQAEDAWRDLERELKRLRQDVSNKCWKLDGPHLDGRFPRGPRPAKQAPMELAAVVR